MPLMTGGTLVTDAGTVEGDFAVNLKLRQVPTADKPGTCTSHGGLTQTIMATSSTDFDRGGIYWNGLMYRVQGASLYSFDTIGIRTFLGAVANDGLRCRFDYSFDFLMVVSGGSLYYYAPTGFSKAASATVVDPGVAYRQLDLITIGALGNAATLEVATIASGTQATATSTITEAGAFAGVNAGVTGRGYITATVTVDATYLTSGTPATVTANITNGSISSYNFVANDGVYSQAPALTVSAWGEFVLDTVTIKTAPQILTKFLPTNPVPQVLDTSGGFPGGGSGVGATFNLTWTSIGNFIEVDMSLSAGITPIVDACFIAGYVMVTDGTDVWCSSLVNLAFFPGYYGSAEYDPDGISAIFKLNNQLYVLGLNTTQTMANTGGNNFPFTAQQSYTFDIGCITRQAACLFNRTLAWIGGGRNMPNGVWFLNGNSPQKISSTAVDFEIGRLTAAQLATVTVEAISFEDSELLYVHLPTKTLMFDAIASAALGVKFWTQLNSGPTNGDQYRARNFVRFNNAWMCGDISDNRVGYLDSTTGGHYGLPVMNRSSSPMVMLPLASAGLRSVELKCVTGQSGDTSRVGMTYSADGIRWSQMRFAAATPRGNYSGRIRWLPGGLTRNKMQVRIEHVTTQHVSWFGCDIELEALNT